MAWVTDMGFMGDLASAFTPGPMKINIVPCMDTWEQSVLTGSIISSSGLDVKSEFLLVLLTVTR